MLQIADFHVSPEFHQIELGPLMVLWVSTSGNLHFTLAWIPTHILSQKIRFCIMEHLVLNRVLFIGFQPLSHPDSKFWHRGRICLLIPMFTQPEIDWLPIRSQVASWLASPTMCTIYLNFFLFCMYSSMLCLLKLPWLLSNSFSIWLFKSNFVCPYTEY